MRLDEFVASRIVEAVVHGLDLTDALGRDPFSTPRATVVTAQILDELLARSPSSPSCTPGLSTLRGGPPSGRAPAVHRPRACSGSQAINQPVGPALEQMSAPEASRWRRDASAKCYFSVTGVAAKLRLEMAEKWGTIPFTSPFTSPPVRGLVRPLLVMPLLLDCRGR